MSFCSEKQVDFFYPSIIEVLAFLTDMFEKGLSYSSINTARSAISTFISIDNVPVGQVPLICRFMKGVFNERPCLPRYRTTWDVNLVLQYLKSLSPVKDISLKMLSKKLVMLFALLSAQRAQTLHLLDIHDMTLSYSKVTFQINNLVKQSRPGRHLDNIVITGYAPARRLCLITVLKEYLKRTLYCRGSETKLFISYVAPHHRVSRDTISRWIVDVMFLAGVDTKLYRSHSTRAACVSSAVRAKVPVDIILKTAGWSQDSTFAKYYKKPIRSDTILSTAILDAHNK